MQRDAPLKLRRCLPSEETFYVSTLPMKRPQSLISDIGDACHREGLRLLGSKDTNTLICKTCVLQLRPCSNSHYVVNSKLSSVEMLMRCSARPWCSLQIKLSTCTTLDAVQADCGCFLSSHLSIYCCSQFCSEIYPSYFF